MLIKKSAFHKNYPSLVKWLMYSFLDVDCDYYLLVILLIAYGLKVMYISLQGLFSGIISEARACQVLYLVFLH